MKKSFFLALFILFSILAYFGVHALLRKDDASATPVKGSQSILEREAAEDTDLPKVVTQTFNSELHPVYLALKGRTAPNRTVTVRAATTGVVVEAPELEGRNVKSGTLLCRLNIDVRNARLAEAKALVEAERVDYDAAAELARKGWAPQSRAIAAKASLDAALASLNSAELEIKRTEIRAPFAGVFEARVAETGDYLSPGSACGTVTDLNPILIQAEITEEFATRLTPDMPVNVSILGDSEHTGIISYVARTANEATRTFRIEAEVENADNVISAGLTSDIRVPLGETLATAMSPGLLTLHDDGRVGVRYVSETGYVTFAPVEIIDDTSEGIWVTGLPDQAQIVSFGQEYISDGARVVAVPDVGTGTADIQQRAAP